MPLTVEISFSRSCICLSPILDPLSLPPALSLSPSYALWGGHSRSWVTAPRCVTRRSTQLIQLMLNKVTPPDNATHINTVEPINRLITPSLAELFSFPAAVSPPPAKVRQRRSQCRHRPTEVDVAGLFFSHVTLHVKGEFSILSDLVEKCLNDVTPLCVR
eukprot:GHVN01035561.1.p1 GENE.GHVN01035561.1~~GHVN01035561.1.p1  ORF type:complete len:160 (+),score=13.55 GHVN01035561.1:2-481(+)